MGKTHKFVQLNWHSPQLFNQQDCTIAKVENSMKTFRFWCRIKLNEIKSWMLIYKRDDRTSTDNENCELKKIKHMKI